MARVLYFDIDGVLVDYEDRPKSALLGGIFERAVREAGFEQLVCVSGWAAMAAAPVLKIPPRDQGGWLYQRIAGLFPSRDWFLEHLVLCEDPDRRGWSIDVSADWYYVDDWADKFFPAAHGPTLYAAELGRRICLANAHGDGSDVLAWVRRIHPVPTPRGRRRA